MVKLRQFLCASTATLAAALPQSFDAAAQDHESYYPKDAIWGVYSEGDLNISCFVFRDLNRNGVYDLVDRPMANIVVELTRPEGDVVFQRSNINGFANFKMSALKEDADIIRGGHYEYRTIVPPDWVLTTGNAVQSTLFEIFPGAPADIVSSTPATAVGLAPVLKIDGQIQQPATLVATGPDGTQQEIATDNDGNFTIPVTSGVWHLLALDRSAGHRTERRVIVSEVPVRLSKMNFHEGMPPLAPVAHLINFEDLIKSISILEIPSGYGQLGWRNWVMTHNLMYGGEGYVNTTNSGEFVAYNSSGHPVKIFRDKPFDFRGGYFGVAWRKAEGEILMITGWRNDKLVYEDSIQLSSLGPVYFDADYRAVTRLEFATLHYWQFVSDDLLIGLQE